MGSKFPQLSVLNKAYSPANVSFRLLALPTPLTIPGLPTLSLRQ